MAVPTAKDYPPQWVMAGRHGEYASLAHVPETVAVHDEKNKNNNATSHRRTVDLAAAKLNNLYGGGKVPHLDGPEKFCRSSKGHMHDNTSASRPPSTLASPITAYIATTVILSPVNTLVCPKYLSERRQWLRKSTERRRRQSNLRCPTSLAIFGSDDGSSAMAQQPDS